MNIVQLTEEISKVAPIHGIDSTGNISFKSEATSEQILQATTIMETNLINLNLNPEIVYTCSAWQMCKVLILQGLIEAVETAVETSNNPIIKYGWARAASFNSNDPLVLEIGTSLGKSEEEIINLIKTASTL